MDKNGNDESKEKERKEKKKGEEKEEEEEKKKEKKRKIEADLHLSRQFFFQILYARQVEPNKMIPAKHPNSYVLIRPTGADCTRVLTSLDRSHQ